MIVSPASYQPLPSIFVSIVIYHFYCLNVSFPLKLFLKFSPQTNSVRGTVYWQVGFQWINASIKRTCETRQPLSLSKSLSLSYLLPVIILILSFFSFCQGRRLSYSEDDLLGTILKKRSDPYHTSDVVTVIMNNSVSKTLSQEKILHAYKFPSLLYFVWETQNGLRKWITLRYTSMKNLIVERSIATNYQILNGDCV